MVVSNANSWYTWLPPPQPPPRAIPVCTAEETLFRDNARSDEADLDDTDRNGRPVGAAGSAEEVRFVYFYGNELDRCLYVDTWSTNDAHTWQLMAIIVCVRCFLALANTGTGVAVSQHFVRSHRWVCQPGLDEWPRVSHGA